MSRFFIRTAPRSRLAESDDIAGALDFWTLVRGRHSFQRKVHVYCAFWHCANQEAQPKSTVYTLQLSDPHTYTAETECASALGIRTLTVLLCSTYNT